MPRNRGPPQAAVVGRRGLVAADLKRCVEKNITASEFFRGLHNILFGGIVVAEVHQKTAFPRLLREKICHEMACSSLRGTISRRDAFFARRAK